MKTSVNVLSVPTCQSCDEPLGTVVYDSPINNIRIMNRWAHVCEFCFRRWGNPAVATKHTNLPRTHPSDSDGPAGDGIL